MWHVRAPDASELAAPQLAATRTPASFRVRLIDLLTATRVVGSTGKPDGLCIVKQDELHQLYVAPSGRGCGVAQALLTDAEARRVQSGVRTAWLACAIGNHRAARFYEKARWIRGPTMPIAVEIVSGRFTLEVWRYHKALVSDGSR